MWRVEGEIMKEILIVGAGGFLGAISRFLLGGWVLRSAIDWKFPLGTFLVNITGCLGAGILAGLVEKRGLFSADARLFLFVGILGGFTTFSAFGLETFNLLRRGALPVAAAYIFLSVGVGLLALWCGFKLSA